jgi:hypothetical protein
VEFVTERGASGSPGRRARSAVVQVWLRMSSRTTGLHAGLTVVRQMHMESHQKILDAVIATYETHTEKSGSVCRAQEKKGKMPQIKMRDECVYEFETGPDDGREDRCEYVHRVSVHQSIKFGGASVGRCTNTALPGMCMCYIHAPREAMAMVIRLYAVKVNKYEETHEAGV